MLPFRFLKEALVEVGVGVSFYLEKAGQAGLSARIARLSRFGLPSPHVRTWLRLLVVLVLVGCGARTDLAVTVDAAPPSDGGAPAFAEAERTWVMRADNMLMTLRWSAHGTGSPEVARLRARFVARDTDGMGFLMERDAVLSPVSTPISIHEEIPLPRERWTRLPLRDECDAFGCEMQFYFGHVGGDTAHPATIDLRVELELESPSVTIDRLEIIVHSLDD